MDPRHICTGRSVTYYGVRRKHQFLGRIFRGLRRYIFWPLHLYCPEDRLFSGWGERSRPVSDDRSTHLGTSRCANAYLRRQNRVADPGHHCNPGHCCAIFVDTLAGKISSAGLIGIFFAFDPTLGTIVGAVFLDQALTTTAIIGIVLVIVAGAGIVWSASRHVPEADFPDATEVIR